MNEAEGIKVVPSEVNFPGCLMLRQLPKFPISNYCNPMPEYLHLRQIAFDLIGRSFPLGGSKKAQRGTLNSAGHYLAALFSLFPKVVIVYCSRACLSTLATLVTGEDSKFSGTRSATVRDRPWFVIIFKVLG
jgi:hypothetical protein